MLKRATLVVALAAVMCAFGGARAQDADLAEDNQPDAKPVSVAGCWQGTVFNTAFCSTDCLLTLVFAQKGKSISKHGSTYDIAYTGRAPLMGVLSGSTAVRRTFPIQFHGPVAIKGCTIHFFANDPMAGLMDGNFHYSGPCTEQQLTSGDFSVKFLGPTCP
jgi:hypothetical protein